MTHAPRRLPLIFHSRIVGSGQPSATPDGALVVCQLRVSDGPALRALVDGAEVTQSGDFLVVSDGGEEYVRVAA